MIVRRFLLWARSAPPTQRARATAALAEAYLSRQLSSDDLTEAETALTAMLDDGSPLVRRAMADRLADSPDAPRHIIVALAGDQGEVAEPVLARSPLLLDADLVDCAALGDERVQSAIAQREWLSASVSAALAEIARPAALARLAGNAGAQISHAALARMVERHGDQPALREALLGRPDLPVDIAQAIAAVLARVLGSFVVDCGWLSAERSGRITREARERTTVALSVRTETAEVRRLVRHLRQSDQLTPALILRAMLSGQAHFAEAAFSELTGVANARVAGIFRDPHRFTFRALFAKAGLPDLLRPAFEAALTAGRDQKAGTGRAKLSRCTIERALKACDGLPADEAGRLVALLRRFDVEAARDEARDAADGLADEAALALVMEHAPQTLLAGERSVPIAA